MNPTERLQELFLKFPGIGPKQAARFVYFLLRQKSEYKDELIKNIEALKDSSHICERCLRVYSKNLNNNLCEICNNPNRDSKSIMIVVKELDIDAIEKTGFYNGKYFVLGSVLPFLTEKPSEILNIKELVNLVSKNIQEDELKIEEVVFAMPVTDEGENTINYLKKTLSQIVGAQNIKMSTLARGLSTGLDIEYVDRNTFKEAFNHRD